MKEEEDAAKEALDTGSFSQFLRRPRGRKARTVTLRVSGSKE
jgi:hypothetical protein